MISAVWLESSGILLAVLTPLVAVPLTVITFYLRSLREQQVSWSGGVVRRVELLESTAADLRKTLAGFERDYTGKEEWLRECMHTRRLLEQLLGSTVRIETTMRLFHAGRGPGSESEPAGVFYVPGACRSAGGSDAPGEGNE